MNPIITLFIWILFVGFISEILYRVTSDYSEPNNLLGEEE